MKKLTALALSVALLMSTATTALASTPDTPNTLTSTAGFETALFTSEVVDSTYHLAKYDVIRLHALGIEDTLIAETSKDSTGITIGPDGYASIPYIGRIKLAGLTLDEATATIERELGEYLVLRGFSVSIVTYAPRSIYVIGAVKSPGIKALPVDNLNIYAAVSAGGGVTNRGRSKHIEVIRLKGSTMYHREVNIDAFVKKHDISQNVVLQDGDIVYVPESNKIVFSEDVAPYISIFGTYKALTD